jgi:hypothetical protein
MRKNIHLPLSVLLLSFLQACGGGGDGDAQAEASGLAPPETEKPATSDIGRVTAKFIPKEKSRPMLFSMSGLSIGSGGPFEQADSGAMVSLGSNTLSGPHRTVDISGDAHFALGRWVNGTVTRSSGTYTLTGKDHESYHYLAFNGLTELPTSGKLQCTAVATTAPTALSDTHAKLGSASGTASVSFDTSGAAIQGTIQVNAGGETTVVNLPTQLEEAGPVTITGNLLANGPGAALVLADQGNDVPGLAVGYRAQLPGGTLYTGVARFACTRS